MWGQNNKHSKIGMIDCGQNHKKKNYFYFRGDKKRKKKKISSLSKFYSPDFNLKKIFGYRSLKKLTWIVS